MIDLPESYEDSEKEANDDEMREAMTYTHEQVKEILGKITQGEWTIEGPSKGWQGHILHGGECWDELGTVQDSSNAIFIASAPSIIRQLVDENEKLVGRVEELRKLDTLSREIDGEEIQRLKDELASSEDCTKRVAHQYVHLKKDIERLQAEVERLEKDRNMHWDLNDRFDHENTKLKKELQRLQSQLAKYEVVVEKAIKFCESGSIHHRNQLQEALKHL